MRILRTWGLACGLLALAGAASANSYDGSKPLLCALHTSDVCVPVDGCSHGNADDANVPRFVRMDFKKDEIEILDEGRRGEITKIRAHSSADGRTMVQGIEGPRGWTVSIDQATGELTLAATGDELGFVVFGHCIPD